MCCILPSAAGHHKVRENTLYNWHSWFSLNVSPRIVVPLDLHLHRKAYQYKWSIQHLSLHITIILSEDRITILHCQIWIWIILLQSGRSYVCICFLPSDVGNAKTNVEGQTCQIQSFYSAKEFRKKILLWLVSLFPFQSVANFIIQVQRPVCIYFPK